MTIKSKADIQEAFRQYLAARFPIIDTTEDRPLFSLFLNSIANQLTAAYEQLNQVQVEQGVSDPTTSTNQGMEDLAYNWNLTRRGAIASTGVITFQKLTVPTTTIRIGNQDGSGGVVVATSRQSTGTVVLFTTIETVYLTPSTPQNTQTGYYEVDAEISCLSLGTIGNVDAGLINVLQSPVPGVNLVTNKISTTGGREEESNAELANRIVNKVQGLSPGITKGLVSIALAQNNVIDAIVAGPNDSEFTRAGTAGAVDVIVLGQQITPSVLYSTYTTNQPYVILSNRPATQISSVVATVGLTQTTLTPNVDYQFVQDTSSSALSAESSDRLAWLSARQPNSNSQVTINYQYDKVINAIQSVVDADDQHFITADVLVKRATQVTVDIALTVTKVSGFDSTVVSNNVATAISNLINNLGLGDPVQQSDLAVAIEEAEGVDSVRLPFTTLAIRGSTGVDDVEPTKYQYARVDSTSLTITVS